MALQNLCLEAIVTEFERYHTAFSTTENANLKRMLEFLQRVYSFEIATQIYEIDKMEEKYTDFLINKYLKILHAEWFNNSSWKTATARIADIGDNIKEFHLQLISVDRLWEEIFCYLPNLEVVHIYHTCIDEILLSIAKFCPNITEIDITEIDIGSSHITEEGLKSLCKEKNGKIPCPKLKKLFLGSCDIGDAAAIYLIKNLPSLEIFDYHNLPIVLHSIHKDDLTELDKIPPYNLTKLELSIDLFSPDFNNILKICLAVCPFLTTLTCILKQPEQLDFLFELNHLETLKLEYLEYEKNCVRINHIDINNFLKSKGTKLTSLTIGNCSLSLSILAETCPGLKVLSMTAVKFEQYDGNSLPLFHNLKSFTVKGTNFSDIPHNLKPLCIIMSSSPKLESLGIDICSHVASELKAEVLKCCEHCCLKQIDLSNSCIDKAFVMDVLLTCHSLESINLMACNLSSDDEFEIYRCVEILPNNPEVFFSDQSSDYDDFFEDYYDNDLDDDEFDDYDDYPHVCDDEEEDDDDYEDVYGYYL